MNVFVVFIHIANGRPIYIMYNVYIIQVGCCSLLHRKCMHLVRITNTICGSPVPES